MRRNITFLLLSLAAMPTLMAQDVIVTKQSERIDATILEVSDSEVRYKRQNNPTGPTFTLVTSKIATILYANGEVQTFEEVSDGHSRTRDMNESPNHLYRGLELGLSAGANIYFSSLGNSAGFIGTASIGRRFNETLYGGVSVGYIPTAEMMSFLAVVRTYIPLNGSRLEFSPEVGIGMTTDFNHDPFFTLLAVPALQMPLSPSIDLRMGIGTNISFASGGSSALLLVNAGLGWHRSTTVGGAKKRVGILEQGLLVEADGFLSIVNTGSGGAHHYAGFAIVPQIGYLFNGHLSVGAGLDYGRMGCVASVGDHKFLFDESKCGVNHYYLWANYRFLRKRISPFAGLEAGISERRLRLWEPWEIEGQSGYYVAVSSFAISPIVGLSWRVADNSYINIRCRYDYALRHPSIEGGSSSGTLNLSHLFFGIGFAQTIAM